jgi:hypothetical protein
MYEKAQMASKHIAVLSIKFRTIIGTQGYEPLLKRVLLITKFEIFGNKAS